MIEEHISLPNNAAARSSDAPSRSTTTLPYPLESFEGMVEMATRACRCSKQEAERRLRLEIDSQGSNVRADLSQLGLPYYKWSNELADFYRTTQAFVYELLVWNALPSKHAMRKWILNYFERAGRKKQRILCVGDGLGFDSTVLAWSGHRPVHFEVSTECRKLAADVFAANGADVEMADTLDDLAEQSFDAILCLDVLEHVPEPADYVGVLARLLKPGGVMMAHAPFWRIDPGTPTHLRQNLKYCADLPSIFGAHGLQLRAGRFLWHPIVLEKSSEALAGSPRARLALVEPWLGRLLLRSQRPWPLPLIAIVRRVIQHEQRQLSRRLFALHGNDK